MSDTTLPKGLLKPDSESKQQLVSNMRLAHLLHHRSKNQHGRSPWYRHFNKFRRELKSLCKELAIDLGPGFDMPILTSDTKAKIKKQSATSQLAIVGRAGQQKAIARLDHWITSGLVVRCYTAFSSLAATPSFSPIALTLIAILARVCSVTGVTAHMQNLSRAEEDRAAEDDSDQVSDALMRFAEEDAGELFDRVQDGDKTDSHDHGAAVKREIAAAENVPKPAKRRKKANAIDDLFAGL